MTVFLDTPPDLLAASLWTRENLATFLFALWIVAFGASVGSFLNVVIYRWPAGRRLAYPGSRCPRCGHAIRWYDNIPVLSWLWLRARCRDCGTPIAVRYPLVEAAMAGLFLYLFWIEGHSGGRNLPLSWYGRIGGGMGWQALGIMAYHLTWLSILLCAILIRFDGHRVPARLLLFGLLVGLLTPLCWPELRPVPWLRGGQTSGWQMGLLDGLAGLAVGTAAGGLAPRVSARSRPALRRRRSFTPEAALAGLFLGWQAGLVLVLFTLAMGHLSLWTSSRARTSGRAAWQTWLPWNAWLLPGTLLYITAWHGLVRWLPLLGGKL